jgi:hypothetical protein
MEVLLSAVHAEKAFGRASCVHEKYIYV